MTNRKIFSFCTFILLYFSFTVSPFYVLAQETNLPVDSLKGIKVMVIPYDPLYYLSDADHEIAEQSNIDMREIRSFFHKKISYYTAASLARNFTPIDLLNDTSANAQEDLITVFSTLGYRYEEPMPVSTEIKKMKPEPKRKEEIEDPYTATKYKNLEGDLKYMHAVLAKPELLKVLQAKYGADYFIFLNQFEIKTNYNSCLDIGKRIYQRTVMMHYSVYDYKAVQVGGNFAYTFFPSNSNEFNELVKNCFPVLGQQIAKDLLQHILGAPAKK